MKQRSDIIQSRRNQIFSLIKQEQSVSINRLDEAFDVSVLTLRRDLDYLEEQGLIERFHGGARIRQATKDMPFFDEKLMSQRSDKQLIAHYLASQIPTGTSLFMNGGTTILEVIRSLKNHNATIITNNVMAFDAASGSNNNILCTGGEYNNVSKAYSGDLATCIIEKTFAEYCILGVNGISSKLGVTTAVYAETLINNLMAQRCKGPIIIAADATKIGKSFCFSSLPLKMVSELVTISSADPRELEAIANAGVKITLADRVE